MEISPCLLASAFGHASVEPVDGDSSATASQFVPSCVGCRLGSQLAALDAFVAQHSVETPPHLLYRLAADLYQTRIRPAVGDTATEWPHEAMRRHYESCVLDVRLSTVRICRELRAMRQMILDSLHKKAADGEASSTLALYLRVSAQEASQHTMLGRLPPPGALHATTLPVRPPPHARSALSCSSMTHEESSMDDADSAAETTHVRPCDAVTAQQALRDALFELIEPCCPPPSMLAQPKLTELAVGVDTADVIARDRLERLQGFQDARPESGRRCFCHGRRRAKACHISLDQAFLEELMGAKEGLRRHYRESTALRHAILSLLRLRPGPLKVRRGYRAHSVFGFRLRR